MQAMSTIVERSLLEEAFDHLWYRGKVRDIYEVSQWLFFDLLGSKLLMRATDRISAFDVVIPTKIPEKGKVLTLLSAFWFQKTAPLVPNHFITLVTRTWLRNRAGPKEERFATKLFKRLQPSFRAEAIEELANRSMIVKRAQRIDIECVVRGYLAGSAWAEYRKSGTVSGLPLPRGLVESQRLPQPLFTPTTKATAGHDQPITFDQMADLVGKDPALSIREKSLALYQYAHDYALPRRVIIADTKFEFGLVDGQLTLIDELLTPDSSRFWDTDLYSPGHSQPSFDKQPVRDWLVASGWDQEPPAPELPPDIVAQTTTRYREAYRRLTGRPLPR